MISMKQMKISNRRPFHEGHGSMDEVDKKVKELLIEERVSEASDVLVEAGRLDDAIYLQKDPSEEYYYLGEDGLKEKIRREWEAHIPLTYIMYEVAEIMQCGNYYSLCYVVDDLLSINQDISEHKLRHAFKEAIINEIPKGLKKEAWKYLRGKLGK